MDLDHALACCLALPGAVETYPFGDEVAVIKVGGRMFGLLPLGASPASVSLKCDPDLATALRAHYPAVTPGYHLNKRHWITVVLDGTVPDDELAEWIEHSWELVVAKLPKAQRAALGNPAAGSAGPAGPDGAGPDGEDAYGPTGAVHRR